MSNDLNRNVMLDGGTASTWRLDRPTCADSVDEWVLTFADEVSETHAQFANAGCAILLTSTVNTLPHRRQDWRAVVSRAVALARQRAGAAEVWGTIGPASTPGHKWADEGFDARARLTDGWREIATAFADEGVQGFALQSFTDPIELAAAIAQVRGAVPRLPIAACLTPADDGRLIDGSDPAPALQALRQAGATWVGFNCGSGPAAIEAAVARAPDADWAKPSRGGSSGDDLIAALVRLAGRCRYVGGCCGVQAGTIAMLRRATTKPLPEPVDEVAMSDVR